MVSLASRPTHPAGRLTAGARLSEGLGLGLAADIDGVLGGAMSLETALAKAMMVIDSYACEIRNANETIGVDLLASGFCQGSIFRMAKLDILKELDGPPRSVDWDHVRRMAVREQVLHWGQPDDTGSRFR